MLKENTKHLVLSQGHRNPSSQMGAAAAVVSKESRSSLLPK